MNLSLSTKTDSPSSGTSQSARADRAFSLVEVLMVVTLLSLIVLALMAVFNSTQSAFRSGVTQTGVLESSEAAMGLMASDLKSITQSGGNNILWPNGTYGFANVLFASNQCGVNFFASSNLYYQPLVQGLVGSGQSRTNVLQNFFILSRANVNGRSLWIGTGYAVNATNASPLYPLYRFFTNAPASTSPDSLFNAYMGSVALCAFTNVGWSHLVDGVVDLRVRAYDPSGSWLTNGYNFTQMQNLQSHPTPAIFYLPPVLGEAGVYFFSNAVPATVELQMGVLEDRVLAHAESLSGSLILQSNYLSQQAGRVHIFRQRVAVPNLDPTAYSQ